MMRDGVAWVESKWKWSVSSVFLSLEGDIQEWVWLVMKWIWAKQINGSEDFEEGREVIFENQNENWHTSQER